MKRSGQRRPRKPLAGLELTRQLLSGRRVLVVGMARSGRSAARLALACGAREVICTDLRADAEQVPGARAVYGRHDRADFLGADLIVLSPGVPARAPDVQAALGAGVPVVGELGLAARMLQDRGVPVLAVTGTNGKSSTVSLLGQLLAGAGRRVFVGGNLGRPASEAALDLLSGAPPDAAVLEVSSYQLEFPGALRPQAAAVLNLTPDHLARHGDMAGYAEAKLRLLAATSPDGIAALPPEDPWLRAPDRRVHHLGGAPGVDWDSSALTFIGTPDDGPLPLDGFVLPGDHNRANLAAAALLCLGAGLRRAELRLDHLRPLAHRLEPVAEVDGVRWVNDSKATNVDAARVGIRALPGPLVVLLGGSGKAGADYAALRGVLERGAHRVICFGAAGPEIAAALSGLPLEGAPGLEAAVALARQVARTGDAVLLSPACASFDEFRDFEHRGAVFTRLARGR